MFLSLPELQKERGFPHPSRKKKLLKLKRESTRSESGCPYNPVPSMHNVILRGAWHGLHGLQARHILTHHLCRPGARPAPGAPVGRLGGEPTCQDLRCHNAAVFRVQIRECRYNFRHGIGAEPGCIASIKIWTPARTLKTRSASGPRWAISQCASSRSGSTSTATSKSWKKPRRAYSA